MDKKKNRVKSKIFSIAVILVAAFFSFPISSSAAISKTINYQGRLTNTSDLSVADGPYDFAFRIYTVAGGGSADWTESWTNATLWTETGSTTITSGDGGDCPTTTKKIAYTTGTNESSLKAGQYLWNTTVKESATIESVSTGSNFVCVFNPVSAWTNGDDLTNRLYVKGGIFSVSLGTINPQSVDFTGGDYYLGVTVGADSEMIPRKRLTSVPQALNANNLVGDGRIGISNTSPAQDAASISYNPATGANNALSVTYGSGGGTGTALNVVQAGTGFALRVNDDGTATDTTPFVVDATGNVGIGTTNPGANVKLEVAGRIAFDTVLSLRSAGTMYIRPSGSDGSASGQYTLTNTGVHTFYTSGALAQVIFNNGNVGIGTTNPSSAKLEVAGQVKITGGTPGAGYVLTSDANGLASWSDIGSSGGAWTLSGNNLYPDSTAYNVGIGTTTPGSYKLYVIGNTYLNGTTTSTGLLTASAGLTATGTVQINTTGSSNTTIGNTSGGTIAIGAASGSDLALSDAQWSVTGAGAATFASVNKLTITAPATSATLTILNGKTLTVNNTLTFSGTDSTTMTFPSTTASIARIDASQTFTGAQTFSSAPIFSTLTGMLKGNGASALTVATSGTDYIAGSVGAASQVAYFTNTGVLAGSNNFFFNGTNVGIGTTAPGINSPGKALTIYNPDNTVALELVGRLMGGVGDPNARIDFLNYYDGEVSSYARIETVHGGGKDIGDLSFKVASAAEVFTEGIRIKSNGYVGIGTTSPSGKLHVYSAASGTTPLSGYEDFIVEGGNSSGMSILVPDASTGGLAFGSASDNYGAFLNWQHNSDMFTIGTNNSGADIRFQTAASADIMWLDSGGNVGIGTTNPLQKLHVDGQCVTGDTLLSIVKSKEFPMINDQFSNNDSISNDQNFENKRIDEVKGGEMVMSLDEKTGKLIPARIKGLLDMGVKPIFKITTEDGREIRTTGNHPYLTKEGWQKVANLNEGQGIAVPKGDLFLLSGESDQKNNSDGQQSAEDINVDHSVIDGVHSCSLIKNKSIDQKTKDKINPNAITDQFSLSSKKGPMNTEAKNTCPISRITPDNFSDRDNLYNNYSDSSSDVKFVRIAKIELLPTEQVWDIEVEGTHNFVANGIIAHNTYISGNVGIGTTNPNQALEVAGTILSSGARPELKLYKTGTSLYWDLIAGTNNGLEFNYNTEIFGTGTKMFLTTDGNVGIGTTNPNAAKLEVAGQVKITGGSPGASKVLTSDANGLASWTDISASGGAWTLSGVNLYPDSTTYNVGIGTTAPGLKFEVDLAGNSRVADIAQFMHTNLTQGVGIGFNQIASVGSNANNILYIDAKGTGNLLLQTTSTGNVGIGTTNPTQKLYVYGGNAYIMSATSGRGFGLNPNAGTYNQFASYGDGTSSYYPLGFRADSYMFYNAAGGVANVTITNGGNVGIGTTNPTYQLDISGTGNSTNLRVTSSGNNSSLALNNSGTGGVNWRINSTNNAASAGGGKLVIDDGGSDNLLVLNSSTNDVFLGGSVAQSSPTLAVMGGGNVGIGTTVPGALLEVKSSGTENIMLVTNSAGSNSFQMLNSTLQALFNEGFNAAAPRISFIGDTNTGITRISADKMTLITGGTERLTIDSGGNVGIGTTSPETKLSIGINDASANTTQYLRFQNEGAGYVKWGIAKTMSNDLSIMNLDTGAGSTPVMTFKYVAGGGNVGIGTTNPNAAKLEVAGQVKITGGSPGASKVLTSDANGLASWTDISASGGAWTLSGVNLYPDSTTYNVGIGTTTPGSNKLYVNGNTYLNGTATVVTSVSSPTFQGISAAVTFGNASYATTIAGSTLTISPTSWTATPTISGLITATSGLTANGTFTANSAVVLGDGGDDIAINSNDWDISSAGVGTGFTSWTVDNVIIDGTTIGHTSDSDLLSLASGTLTVNGYLYGYNSMGIRGAHIENAAVPRASESWNILGNLTGRKVDQNSDFLSGTTTGYSIYDNGASGDLAMAIVADVEAPNSSANILRVTYTEDATSQPSPGYGGIYHSIGPSGSNGDSAPSDYGQYRKGSRILQKIWAKVPSGRTLEWAGNSRGDTADTTWLTPQTGTGEWEQYMVLVTVGVTGTFSSFGHIYVSGGSDVSFTWDVASYEVWDIDQLPASDRAVAMNVGLKTGINPAWGELYASNNVYTYGNVYSGDLYLGYDDADALLTTQDTNENLTIDPNGSGTVYFHGATYNINSSGQATFNTDETINGVDISAGAVSDVTALTVDNIYLNETTIGHTSDMDLLSLASGALTTNGNVFATGGFSTYDTTVTDNYVEAGGFCMGNGTNCITSWTNVGGSVNGSGTANYIPRWSDTDTLTNSIVYDNGTNVGIGTTNPGAKLEVFKDSPFATESAAGFRILSSNTNGTPTLNFGADNTGGISYIQSVLKGTSYGNSKLAINPNGGNVGIGTTGPSNKLSVQAGSVDIGTNLVVGSNAAVNSYQRIVIGGTVTAASGLSLGEYINANLTASANNDLLAAYYINPTFTNGAYTGVKNYSIYSPGAGLSYFAGNVGIGTAGPAVKLDVVGAVKTSRLGHYGTYNSAEVQGIWSISEAYLISTASNNFGTQYGIGYAYSTNGGALFTNEHQILFTTSGTITSAISLSTGKAYFAGNVGIGTTNPGAKIDVVGGAIRTDSNGYTSNNIGGTGTASYHPGGVYAAGSSSWLYSGINYFSGILSSATAGNWQINQTTNSYLNASGGNVGIGTTSPATPGLHIVAGTQVSNPALLRVQSAVETSSNYGDAYAGIEFGVLNGQNSAGTQQVSAFIKSVDTRAGSTSYDDGGIAFGTLTSSEASASAKMILTAEGNLGIGTTNPGSYKLYVASGNTYLNGTVTITGGTPGANKVLTSDANGLASWTTLGSGSISDIYLLNTGDTGTGAYTFSGGIFSINASSNYATNINTGSSTGAVAIGGGSNDVSINSNDWDISSAGVGTGFTSWTVDNVIIDGTTIGHTSDSDLLSLASGTLTVNGGVNLTGALSLASGQNKTLKNYFKNDDTESFINIDDNMTIEEVAEAIGRGTTTTGMTKVDDPTAPAPGAFEVSGYQAVGPEASTPYWKVDQDSEYIFEVWIKVVSSTATPQRFYAGWEMYNSAKTTFGNVQRYWGSSGTEYDSNSYNDGEWHHVVARISGVGASTGNFIDGTEYARLVLLMNYNTGDTVTRYAGMKLYKAKKVFTSIYAKDGSFSTVDSDGKLIMDYSGNITPNNLQASGTGPHWFSSGNVGIGTTNPGSYKLYVNGGDIYTSGDMRVAGDDLFMATNTANYFLMADGTNYNPTDPASARTGLGLSAGGTGDIWVEKAGDTMTGDLVMGTGVQIDFYDEATDKIYWYSNTYGTGIESSTLTNWSSSQFRWRIGGTSVSSGTEELFMNGTTLRPGANGGLDLGDATYRYGTLYVNDICMDGSSDCVTSNIVDGTGSANYITKWTDGDTLTYSSLLYDNGTNVGIGTASPGTKLQVVGAGVGANFLANPASIFSIADSRSMAADVGGGITFVGSYTGTTGTTFAGIRGVKANGTDSNYSGRLEFFTRNHGDGDWTNDQRMVIDNTGNVGIGTTSPQERLDVNGYGVIDGLNVGTYADYSGSYGTLDVRNSSADASVSIFGSSGRRLTLSMASSATISTSNDHIILSPAGNVGIGTTNPTLGKLQVFGSTYLNGDTTNTGYLSITGAQNASGNLRFSAANPYIYASSYTIFPGGLYVSGGTFYAQNTMIPRGGIRDDEDEDTYFESRQGLGFNIDYDNNNADTEYFSWNKNGSGFGAGSELMRLTETGYLGIGTTNPGSSLHVVSGAGSTTVGYSMGFFDGGTATLANLYGVGIQRSSVYGLMLGSNKNSATGSVPSLASYISTMSSTGTISIGRGNGSGLPSTSDIFVNGSGEVFIQGNLYIGTSVNYLSSQPSGDYGSIQVNASGKGAWEGYSIDGRAVFMHDGATATGIYNDVDNEWLINSVHNAATSLYYNGSTKLATTNTGVAISGGLSGVTSLSMGATYDPDVSFNNFYNYPIVSGSTVLTAARSYIGTYTRLDTNASSSNATYSKTGYAAFNVIYNGLTGNNSPMNSIFAEYNQADNRSYSAATGSMYGSYNYVINRSNNSTTGDVTNMYGLYGYVYNYGDATNASDVSTMIGVQSYLIHANTTGTGSATTGYLFNGSYTDAGDKIATKYGVYITGEDKNYFSNNVGIGTTSPRQKLDVVGNIITDWDNRSFGTWYVDGSSYRMGFDTNTSARKTNIHAYSSDSNGTITFSTGTVASPSEKMRIANGGNVGIGTTNPEYLLEIGSLTKNTSTYMRLAAESGYHTAIRMMEDTDTYGFSLQHDAMGNMFNIKNHENSSTGSPAISILRSNGNVGIGTTNPNSQMEVYSSSNANGPFLRLTNAGTSNYSTGVDFRANVPSAGTNASYSSGRIYSVIDSSGYANTRLTFANATAEGTFTDTMSLKNGYVGIGTTSPTQKLEVNGRISMTTWTADGDTAAYRDTATNSLALVTSDRRLKKNIVPIKNSLDIVNQMNTYVYNELDETDGTKKRLGVMAQEILPIMPELTYTFSREGSNETYYGVHYDKLPVLLLGAMKEQQTQISQSLTLGEANSQALGETSSTLDLKISENKADVAELQAALNDKLSFISNALSSDFDRIGVAEKNIDDLETRLTAAETKLLEQENNLADFQTATNDLLSTMIETENMLTEKVLSHEERIAALEAKLATATVSMDGGEISFPVVPPANAIAVDANGNASLAGIFQVKEVVAEKIVADGVVAGSYAVKNEKDSDALTVGKATIFPELKDEDGDGINDITGSPMPLDADGDGVNDATGKEIIPSDGKSVDVRTKAVSEKSKIFVTANRPAQVGVTKIAENEGFVIEVSEPITEELKINWFIVEEK